MKKPVFSIIIPTYNSGKNLSIVLGALKQQSFPQNKIEIIIVDGGSRDNTLKIAKEYKCKIIPNPKVQQVFAKHLGHIKAKGRYVVHLDSDEELQNIDSLKINYYFFRRFRKVKALLTSGYIVPEGYNPVNYLINDFGDPFTYFMHRNSTTFKSFEHLLKKFGKVVYQDKNGVVFDFSKIQSLPLIELSAIGFTIDKKFVDKHIPELKTNPYLISQLFYLLVKEKALFAYIKNEPVVHYSASGIVEHLKKIRSRVINNIYRTEMGMSAFTGRVRYYPFRYKVKQYLFIPYTLSLVLPTIDALRLTIARKKLIFLLYPIISLYTLALIFYYYLLKILKIMPEVKPYGV